ncbi:hypothetical protein [Thalassobellus sediminis]|uniref:hypothetical protein n=1 Tax=Thalassobellus sediminis TaxID=3367753 RepID=UPI0037885B16
MRTVLPYRILLAFIMLPLFVLASEKTDGKYTKKKVINKTYSVSANATLKVNNSYGNIDVITWNENRIVFEVTITTSGNDEEKVQKKLDNIGVDFEGSSNFVSAKTIFSKSKSSSWWNWGNNNNVNMKINYVIKIPITNHVDLNNDYGSINLDKLEGVAKINCDYGKITTKELMADNNDINFDYTKGCYFEYIKSGKINADYSDFTVSKSQKININADYTNSKIEVAEVVNYNCDYGSIKIEKANNVTGNGDYLTTYIGDVYKNVSLKSDYGSIKINRLTKNAENITIKGDYVGIKIGYDATHNFTFDINLDYASLRDSDGLVFTKKVVESTSKHYIGYHGDTNSKNTVNIVSDYGSVSLVKK